MTAGCMCQCHGGPGAYPPPCDQPGGCGPHEDEAPRCAAMGCRRTPDPVLCQVDARRLGDWLASLGSLYAHLDPAPSMQGREPGTGTGGGLKSQRAVGDLAVMALRDPRTVADAGMLSVLAVLAGWAQMVRDERQLAAPTRRLPGVRAGDLAGPTCTACGHESCTRRRPGPDVTVPAEPTIASERGLLAAQLPWILAQDWAGAMFDEIRELWTLLDRGVHGPRPARAKRACPHCGGLVTVAAGVAACNGCEATWQGLDMAQLGQQEAA